MRKIFYMLSGSVEGRSLGTPHSAMTPRHGLLSEPAENDVAKMTV